MESPNDAAAPDGLRLLRTILTDVRLLLAAMVAVFLGGYAALAQVQGVAERTARVEVQAHDASVVSMQKRLETHESQSAHTHTMLQTEVQGLKVDVQQTHAEVEGLRRDLRQLFPTLPRSIDGGVP